MEPNPSTKRIAAGVVAAMVAGGVAYISVFCLAQLWEDLPPQFWPLPNVGVLAVVSGVSGMAFRSISNLGRPTSATEDRPGATQGARVGAAVGGVGLLATGVWVGVTFQDFKGDGPAVAVPAVSVAVIGCAWCGAIAAGWVGRHERRAMPPAPSPGTAG